MPRFNFDLTDGTRERDSLELADLQEARLHAARHACTVLHEEPARLRDSDVRVEVSDQTGLLLFTLIVIGMDSSAARVAAH